MELELAVLTAGIKVETLGEARLKIGQSDTRGVVYKATMPLEVHGRLCAMSCEEAEAERRKAKPQITFSHMLVLAAGEGSKGDTVRLYLRHRILSHHWFGNFINFVIAANIFTMARGGSGPAPGRLGAWAPVPGSGVGSGWRLLSPRLSALRVLPRDLNHPPRLGHTTMDGGMSPLYEPA